MHSWERRLSDDERSVLLSELLLRHPELVAEAEEITSTLLVVGLPGAADDLAHMVYKKAKSLHLPLPSLADECPEWAWYQHS